MSGVNSEGLTQLAEVFNRLPWLRQVVMLVALAASIAMGFGVVLWSQEPDYAPVYANLDGKESFDAVNQLRMVDIPAKVSSQTGVLMVPIEHIQRARMVLAAQGIPRKQNSGYELLDEGQAFGTSQFMEVARYKRSIEGELSRTIISLRNVTSARVHLAIPKQSVFLRDKQTPTASVFVDIPMGKELGTEQVSAITHMVSSSVPNMKSSDVTVVDQNGKLLTKNSGAAFGMTARELEYERELENYYVDKIESMLSPLVGPGRSKAQVSVDMDFTMVTETKESYDPSSSAIKAEEIYTEKKLAEPQPSGIPGAASNGPPGTTDLLHQDEGGGAISAKEQTSRSYDVDHTISHVKSPAGTIKRITVAVLLDDKQVINAKTKKVTTEPLSAKALDNITKLVKDAVGFDAERGDSINVINSSFAQMEEEEPLPEPPIWSNPWFLPAVKQVLAVFFILFLVQFVLRPVLRGLVPEQRVIEIGEGGEPVVIAGGEAGAAAGGAAPPGAGGVAPEPVRSSPLITPDNIEETMRLLDDESADKQIDALRKIVTDDPASAAQVVRMWMRMGGN